MIDTKHILLWLVLGATASPAGQLEDWRAAMSRASSAQAEQKIDDALAAYGSALQIASADPRLELARAMTLAARGSLLHDLERTTEAEKNYVQALTLYDKHRDDPGLADHVIAAKLSLASLYLELDQPSKAVKLRLEDHLGSDLKAINRGRLYGVLAGVAYAQRRFADAEVGWLKEIAITEAEDNLFDTATALSNLAVLAAAKGDYHAAAVRLRRAVELFEAAVGPTSHRSIRARSNLGQVLMQLGERDEAMDLIRNAYQLAMRWFGADNPTTVRLCLDYAGALRMTGKKQEAKALEAGLKRLPGAAVAALRQRSTVDVMQLK